MRPEREREKNTPEKCQHTSDHGARRRFDARRFDERPHVGNEHDHRTASDDELPSTGVSLDFERLLSSRFIRSPGYGTRACSVLSFDRQGRIEFSEQNYLDAERSGAGRHECIDVSPSI